jgi:hypothetical protein
MAKLRLPADIASLMEIGVDHWWANASWPVSEDEFAEQVSVLFSAYRDALNETGIGTRDVLLADVKFIAYLAQVFHAALTRKRCQEQEFDLAYRGIALSYYEPDWDDLGHQFHSLLPGSGSPIYRVREAIRRVRFNRHLSPLVRASLFCRPSKLWSAGALNDVKINYINNIDNHFDIPYLKGLTGRHNPILDVERTEISLALDKFIGELKKSSDLLAVFPDTFEFITTTWQKRLEDLQLVYQAVLASRRLPKQVLCSEMGSPENRIIALAAKRKGAEVVAFSHGNDAGHIEKITDAFWDYSICTKYVALSKRSSEMHAARAKKSGLSACADTKFESSYTEEYVTFLRSGSVASEPGSEGVRTVLLTGFPMHAQRYIYGRGEYFPFRLGAELEVARILKAAGIRVLYKPHPETAAIMSEIMKERVDAILTGSFEAALDQTDCVVFTYPVSTTFGATLGSNIPIVLLDHLGRQWSRDAREKLARRCAIVPCDIDDEGKFQLPADELVEAIKISPSKLDHTYLLEYMAPTNYEPV